MPDTPEASPRARWPLAVAATIAVLVIVGAVAATWFQGRLAPAERAAIDACEAVYAESGEGDEAPPRIVQGHVYLAADWRDLRSLLVEQGFLEDGGPADGEADARDNAAEAAAASGRDHAEVVWFLEGDTHLACQVDLEGDDAVAGTATLGDPAMPAIEVAEG